MPKLHFIYYKTILDLVIKRFFDDFGNLFVRCGDSYTLGKSMSRSKLQKIFISYIKDVILELVDDFDISNPKFYFIIGSCLPKDNIYLKYKDDKYFPKKLMDFITTKYNIKYMLNESDIDIGEDIMNDIFVNIFNDLFISRNKMRKLIGEKSSNTFFIQHRNLDCYAMFRILKNRFGKRNCVNVFREKLNGMDIPLVAVNELILKYIRNKKEIVTRDEFKAISNEIFEFATKCLKS